LKRELNMQVTVAKLSLSLEDTHSLKAKRNIIRSLIRKVKSKHNVSISEVGFNDDFKTSVLGISYVSNSASNNIKLTNDVLDFIDFLSDGFMVIDTQIETITGF